MDVAEQEIYPPYIPREEEQLIRSEVERVRQEGSSRAVLLYGEGGIGKTQMVRALADASRTDRRVAWLDPIDVDDAAYWLMSNLEQQVIDQLDPDHRYFEPYLNDLRRLPGHTLDRIDRETVVSHLDAVKQVFIDCYSRFASDAGKTIVIVFDTVEVIRGVSLLYTLTEWMKSLPRTLFVLSGRPMQSDEPEPDPIQRELEEGLQKLPVTPVTLSEFTWKAAHDFVAQSLPAAGLTDDEKTKLVLLTQGHPLWLAFTIGYLMKAGIPPEAAPDLADLKRQMPYGGPMSEGGRLRHQLYKERLVTQYRDSDFQDEAIKRLAVVRQSISQEIWERLMEDRVAPESISSLSQEWENLRKIPWIRARSSRPYVTLHDAVAEELSQGIIRSQDADRRWRREQWHRAAAIYADLSNGPSGELARQQKQMDRQLRNLDERLRMALVGRSDARLAEGEMSTFVEDIARLDKWRRELDEFRAISLHYELLSDFENGAARFLELFEQARWQRDPLLQERLALEIQRFLPSSLHQYPLEDVVGQAVNSFRTWLSTSNTEYYERIVETVAQYQIENEQPHAANDILGDLPDRASDPVRRFDLNILKGNALMRIPGHSANPQIYFERALDQASAMTSDDGVLLQARAHKELGFYYRQLGRWHAANNAYSEAFSLISTVRDSKESDEYRVEMASIERNWAFVNGISGNFELATNLIESAIDIYHGLNMLNEEAAARSVHGEIYRYGWQFTLAWRAYGEAEQIFEARHNRTWLGVVFQEQAICLVQAYRKGIELLHGRDPNEEAKRLIRQALVICREQNLRAYPSALNRAARVFGADDIDAGLRYAEQGIEWGQRLSDGWKRTACLVEYADLSYQAWVKTREAKYREQIRGYEAQLDAATAETEFVDLRGKWNILQGHLRIQDWIINHDMTELVSAVEHYKTGFRLVAETFVGSSSGFTIGIEFGQFRKLFRVLPDDIRASWLTEFRRAWTAPETASAVMLARLQELY